MPAERVEGKDLRVGDVIETWWTPGRDTVVEIRPYTGPLLDLLGAGTRIAVFAICVSGMTISPDDDFARVASVRG